MTGRVMKGALGGALGGLLLLAGCMDPVGPDYKRPDLPYISGFRFDPAPPQPANLQKDETADAASLSDLPWWQVFDDPDLQALISDSITGSYNVKIAVARVEQARAALGITESQFYPQIGYQFDATRGERSVLGTPAPTAAPGINSATVAGGTLSWQIDLWGLIRRQTEQSRAQLLSTEEAQRGVLLSLVGSVAQNYYTLLEQDLLLQVARDTVVTYSQTYDLFNRRLIGGYASTLETEAAAANLAVVAAQIPTIEQQIGQLENALNVLAGRPPGPIKRNATLLRQKYPPTIPAGLPSTLVSRRPDLRQSEQNLVAANAAVGVAVAQFYPNFALTGLLGIASPQFSQILSGNNSMWAAMGGITGPIFTGGQLESQKKQAIALADQSRLQFQQNVLQAYQEVSNALLATQKVQEARIQQTRAVQALQATVKMATDRYVAGVSSYYEVLQQLQQLYPAQQTMAQLDGNRFLAVVNLYLALGGGWQVKTDEWAGLNAIERQP